MLQNRYTYFIWTLNQSHKKFISKYSFIYRNRGSSFTSSNNLKGTKLHITQGYQSLCVFLYVKPHEHNVTRPWGISKWYPVVLKGGTMMWECFISCFMGFFFLCANEEPLTHAHPVFQPFLPKAQKRNRKKWNVSH